MNAVATPKRAEKEPAYKIYMDWHPSVIGINTRACNQLEKHLNVTSVKDLCQKTKAQVLSTPQVCNATYEDIMQKLCNIGLPVKGKTPKGPPPPIPDDFAYRDPDRVGHKTYRVSSLRPRHRRPFVDARFGNGLRQHRSRRQP